MQNANDLNVLIYFVWFRDTIDAQRLLGPKKECHQSGCLGTKDDNTHVETLDLVCVATGSSSFCSSVRA
jgi:hypothetical protein